MSDFEVSGADQFLALSKALKAAGRTELRKELNKRIKAAAKPSIAAVKDAARSGLPQRGGAGAFFAQKRATVVTATGRDPGVKVRFAKADQRLDTQGRLSHPVFGRPGSRAITRIRPGVLSGGFQESAPEVRDEVEKAIKSVVDDIVREARRGG